METVFQSPLTRQNYQWMPPHVLVVALVSQVVQMVRQCCSPVQKSLNSRSYRRGRQSASNARYRWLHRWTRKVSATALMPGNARQSAPKVYRFAILHVSTRSISWPRSRKVSCNKKQETEECILKLGSYIDHHGTYTLLWGVVIPLTVF